jgi:hypothetical protein
MIPPVVHPECSSWGEREVFNRLKNDPETEKWIVLHSLDMANHIKNISGEADFVVIVPGKGVLCIEVKACSYLRRHEGLWYYGSDPQPDSRGPFRQAAEAMHSIRARLVGRRPDLSRILFWSAVIFPYVEFSAASDEWHPWQVIDARLFRSRSIGKLVVGILDRACTYVQGKIDLLVLGAEQCSIIANELRPAFEFFGSPLSRFQSLNEELKHYTAEQFEALDVMESNQRVAFVGPAGTGKTLLAIEAARRGAAWGRRILLICFNRLLGKWLAEQTACIQPQIEACTLHRYLLTASSANTSDYTLSQSFWGDKLPSLAIEKLLMQSGEKELYDELIVDEAQDILRDNYLDCLDLSIKGGLSSGRWRIFGDFEKQAIYGSDILPLEKSLETRCSAAPIYSLRTNCRNTPRIAELVHLLGGLAPPYRRVLRPDNGIEPQTLYYTDSEEQVRLLVKCLGTLWNEGFRADDITILSAHRDVESIASAVAEQPWKNRLRPLDEPGGGKIRYGSIYAFKGMESPAIVVTDVEKIGTTHHTSLFYVAITRALQRLVILVNKSAKQEMVRILLER